MKNGLKQSMIMRKWIGSIKETLKSSSDSGLHDYYAMYWFIKELKLPEP